MKLRAIGLHAGEINTGLVRVHDAEIDAEIGDADLRVNGPVARFESALDGVLERRFRAAAGQRERLGDRSCAVLRVLEEVLEIDDAAGVGAAKVYLFRAHA